ncbi:MAG: DUF2007 domain-containing protein [Opitutales bacterium]
MNFEVIRDHDSAKIGLYKSVLENEGIQVIVKNWECSNITEVPIPALYPTIFVHTEEDLIKARDILNTASFETEERFESWECKKCGETVDGGFAQCWKCDEILES